MTSTQTTSPTQTSFYANHTNEALTEIVARFTSDSLYMATNGATALADEAMKIANAAWAQLTSRAA